MCLRDVDHTQRGLGRVDYIGRGDWNGLRLCDIEDNIASRRRSLHIRLECRRS